MENIILHQIDPYNQIKLVFILLAGMVILFLPSCDYHPIEPPASHAPLHSETIAGETLTEPIQQPEGAVETFEAVAPIWSKDVPKSNEIAIVLCRYKFSSNGTIENSVLEIFADTRYEVWIDGDWIGRGPARFSKTLREYDIYKLGQIGPGEHLIAVLSQWAPSIRRSESSTPQIKSQIYGNTSNNLKTVATTNHEWRCQTAKAWQQDAVPVHEWKLIGPTELLDFRQLPENWNQAGYQDLDWPAAVSVNRHIYEDVLYQPRSIPRLVNTPVSATLLDAGMVSPEFTIGEITPDYSTPHTITITATNSTSAIIEVVVEDNDNPIETDVIKIDSSMPYWRTANASHPNVHLASIQFDAGEHEITFNDIPSDGITFSISKTYLELQEVPFSQGTHAGRRSLLARFRPNTEEIRVDQSNGQLDIAFVSPPAYAVLDLGRTIHGRLTAEVYGQSGSILDIGWDERLSEDHFLGDTKRPLPFPGSSHPQWNQVDSWIMDGNNRTLTTIDARAGRYILILAWGEDPIELKDIRVYEEHYPVSQVGSFHSSDPFLDQVWQVGVDSLVPTMLDAYVDTPWRERGQWWGDAYVANRINQVAFGDDQLIQRAIRFMADSMKTEPSPGLAPSNQGHHILDYAMLWVHSLAETIQSMPAEPGLILAADNYATLTHFMAHLENFENPETYLLDLPESHWSQNVYIDTYGRDSRAGQSTALNSLYYGTLRQAAFIAELVNDPQNGTEWGTKAQQVKQNINTVLLLPSEHRYLSNIYANRHAEPSPHAQAWPLVYDVVPVEEIPSVSDALLELLSTDPGLPNINVYGMYWALEALGKSGKINEGIDIIRQYYGYMLAKGAQTWWEVFSIYPDPNQSLSHAWGGAPTIFLSKYVLGARQSGPNQWSIQPSLNSIDHASGTIPIQNGLLHVKWNNQSCRKMTVNISSPHNTGGYVLLSYEPSLTIRVDRSLIWHHDKPLSEIVNLDAPHIKIAIAGGEHEISIDRICLLP
jgi:alpha-L-rhamnosidase